MLYELSNKRNAPPRVFYIGFRFSVSHYRKQPRKSHSRDSDNIGQSQGLEYSEFFNFLSTALIPDYRGLKLAYFVSVQNPTQISDPGADFTLPL